VHPARALHTEPPPGSLCFSLVFIYFLPFGMETFIFPVFCAFFLCTSCCSPSVLSVSPALIIYNIFVCACGANQIQMDNFKVGNFASDTQKAIVDSGTSLITGPRSLMTKVLENIKVSKDCSNIASLPPVTITLNGVDYTLTPDQYVLKMTVLGTTQCLAGLMPLDVPPPMVRRLSCVCACVCVCVCVCGKGKGLLRLKTSTRSGVRGRVCLCL